MKLKIQNVSLSIKGKSIVNNVSITVNPGEVVVTARVIKAGNNIAFLEGDILDKKNNLLAKANQTVKLIKNFYY